MSKKRNSVTVGLIRGNEKNSNQSKPDVELVKELIAKGKVVEEMIDPCLVISRLDYPVNVEYGDDTIRLSPRGRVTVCDTQKLGELPNGVVKKRLVAQAPVIAEKKEVE